MPRAVPLEGAEPMLLLAGADGGRLALPLSAVARLEKVPFTALERAGHDEVIQYRGDILRVVRLEALLKERRRSARHPAPEPTQLAQIVVCKTGERRVGILVNRILDIVEESVPEGRPGSRPGVKTVVVLRGRVTELLDVDALISAPAMESPTLGGAAA